MNCATYHPSVDAIGRGIEITHDTLKRLKGQRVFYSYSCDAPPQYERGNRQGIAKIGYGSDDICPCDSCGIPNHHGNGRFWLILYPKTK